MEYTLKKGIHLEAEKQMKDLLGKLGDDADNYTITLDILTDALDTYNKAVDGLTTSGLVITNAQNNLVPSPWVKIKNDAKVEAFKLLKQFGNNPLDKKKLEGNVEEDGFSPLQEFMNG